MWYVNVHYTYISQKAYVVIFFQLLYSFTRMLLYKDAKIFFLTSYATKYKAILKAGS